MEREHFKELCESLRQMKRIIRGEMKPGRVTVYSDAEVAAIRSGPAEAKAARKKLKLSQSQFARLIGVPVSTLQGWEQGRRHPDGPARALLIIAAKRPDAVLEALHSRAVAG